MTGRPIEPGEKLFITGISGFIGSRVAKEAADEGYRVHGLHRPKPQHTGPIPELHDHENIRLREGDLKDPSGIRGILKAVTPDAIIHFGALTSVSYSFDHPREVFAVNGQGTLSLAEISRDTVPSLEKFLFSSSMEVYGNRVSTPPENDPPLYEETMLPKPAAPYAVAKRSAELHLRVLHESFDFPAISFRQSNCYGRRFNDYFVVEAFTTDMLRAIQDGSNQVSFGDPRPWRNFIHVDDLVELYMATLQSDTSHMEGEVFNTGPPNAISIQTLADELVERTGFDGEINWYTREMRPGEVWCLNASQEKIVNALDWEPTVTLDEGLERVVEYWDNKIKTETYN